jgi:hypothetical protein
VTVNSVTPTISTTTASGGNYTLTGVPSGTRTINASLTSYVAANSGNLTVPAGGNVNAGALALNRTTVTVSGAVTDSASGSGISGATVSVQEQSANHTTTNGSGNYSLSGVYWGSIHLVASASNYTANTVPVTLTAGNNTTQNIGLDSAFGTITGQVDDAVSGLGLPDVTVALTDNPSLASGVDAFGNFTLSDVPVGTHTLTATRDNYATAITNPIPVTPGTTAAPVIAMTPDRCSISGIVRDGSTGGGFAGATVTAARDGQTATTDEWGAFTLSGLAPGAELLAVTADGYAPITTDVFVLNAGDTPTDWVLDVFPPGDRTLGTVHGTVRDASGAPLAGATVGLVGGASTTSGADGTYSISAHGGRYALVASKAGFRTIFTPNHGNGPADSDRPWQIQQDFVLPGATDTATLEITAHDPVLLTARDADFWLWTPTAAYRILVPLSGHRTLTGIPAGPLYGLAYPVQLGSGATVALDVHAGPTLPSTSPRWSACGIVVRETTKVPIAGATVTLTNSGATFTTTATTDANGRWSFSGGPLGDYRVEFSGPDGLTRPDPWTFTADEDGFYLADVGLLAPGDNGTVTCSSPAEGTVLTADLTHVDCTATLPRFGDYIVTAVISLSNGQVQTQTPTFDLDGRTFHIDLTSSSQNGPQEVYLSALPRLGNWIDLTIPVVMQQALAPMEVVLNPSEVPGGDQVTGTVILNAPAPTGGQLVTLASDNTAVAAVPPGVTVSADSDRENFTVTTPLRATPASADISATANAVNRSATLSVTPSTAGAITGQVVDAVTGVGLSEVTVLLADNPSIGTGVDWEGRFALANVPPGTHTLTASRTGYADATTAELVVVAAELAQAPDIALTPLAVTISGIVRDGSTGNPVAGATVTAGRTGQAVTTDGNGAFTLSGLSDGAELLAINADGYAPSTTDVLLLNAGDTFTDWVLEIWPPGNRILGICHGIVRDAAGAPLPGATVGLVGGPSTVTADDGTYSIAAHGGRYALVASKAGFRTIFTPNHGDGPATSDRPWQIQQDFILPGAPDTATLEITAHDPVLLTPRESDFTVYTPTAAYRILVPSSGTRTVGNLPAGPLYGRAFPVLLGAGTTVPLDVDGPLTLPGISPNWAAFGTVVRDTTKAPVPGVTVTLTNEGASFATTATTDANGRWSFTNGPLGDYSVTYVGPDGLTRPEPWRFTATEGGWWGETTTLLAPGDTGTITCTAPESGATLTADISRVDCAASLPRPGDYIRVAWISLSNGQIQSQTTSYDLDGRGLHFDVVSSSHNGSQHIDVTAGPRLDDWLSFAIPVVMQKVVVPAQVVLDPAEVPGGTQVNGTVILNVAAPAGGLDVGLSSSNAGVATVPATVNVTEGSDRGWFTVTTLPQAASTSVSISASANGGTSSATLSVTPSMFGSVTGQVVDAATGEGLSEVTVVLSDNPSINTGVDWEGRFTLANVPVGSHTLTASRNGYADVTTAEIIVAPAGVAQPPAINLTPNPVTIQGQLLPVGSGLGLPGATITAARSGQSTVTDGSGNFTLSGLAPGYELLTATREGFAPSTTNEIPLYPGQTVNVGMDIFDGSRPNGVVHGTVQDSAGAPVSDATVAIVGGPSVQTQTDGSYTMTLPGGRYVLRATKAGYRTQVSRNHADAPLWQTNWQVQQDFVLYTPAETGVVDLATADAFTRAPNQGRVWLQGLYEAYWADTSPQGQRTLPAVPAGKLLGWATPRTLTPGGVLDLAFYAGATVPEAPPRWGAYGMAYRATTGEPAPDATVALTNAGASFATTVTTDSRGRWSFTGGPLGAYGVTASAEGGLTSDNRFDFTPEDNGGIYGWNPVMMATTDAGALAVDDPAPGAVLLGGLTSVACTGTLPRPGDYITSAWVNLSQGQVQTQNVAYDIDGRHFRIDVTTAVANGPLTVTVGARTWYGRELSASVDVTAGTPSTPVSLTLNPTDLFGGSQSVGTVSLSAAAGLGGALIGLTSSNPGIASVPSGVTVPQGSLSASFTINTSAVTESTPVTIGATSAGTTQTATLTVRPRALSSLTLNPASVLGGTSCIGTVTLNTSAPSEGFLVTVTTSDPAVASVPATVLVAQGANSAQFIVATTTVSVPTAVTITASGGGATRTAAVEVGPLSVASLVFTPTAVNGGSSATGTVTLNGPAPAGGLTVGLSSGDPAVSVPASVTVGSGGSSATFTATTSTVTQPTIVIVTATTSGIAATGTLTVNPIRPTSVYMAPTSVLGGTPSTGRVYINQAAPTGGLVVALASDNPVAIVPANVTIAASSTTATFTVATTTSASATATISATANGVTVTATLTVTAPGSFVGTVVSAADGSPIAGATVRTTTGGYATTADSGGAFTLAVLPGTYTLSATKDGWLPATVGPLTAATGQSTPTGPISMTQGGIISGHVYYWLGDLHTEWPDLYNATVRVDGTSNATSTGTDGRFTLTQAAGTWTITITDYDMVPWTSAPLVLAAGQRIDLNIRVEAFGGIWFDLVDSVTGAGVGGATVVLSGGRTSGSTTTSSTGNFHFRGAPGDTYVLTITKSGWETKTYPTYIDESRTWDFGNIPFIHLGTVIGSVISSIDSTPIAGATVSGPLTTISTDATGAFSLPVRPGVINLTVLKAGWAPKTSGSVTVVAGQTTNAGTITLDHGGSIVGRVVDASNGSALSGVTVAATGTSDSATTESSGAFTIANLAPGTVTLTASLGGWTDTTTPALTVTTGQTTDAGTIPLHQQWAIHGTVVSAADGSPLSGVSVTATGDAAAADTDAQGAFTFAVLPGNYALTLAKTGWVTSTTTPYVVTANQPVETGALPLTQFGTVRGTVVNAAGGQSLGGVSVTVTGTKLTTYTQQGTGAFQLDVPPGMVTLTVVADSGTFADKTTDPITITSGQTTDVGTIALTLMGRLTGRVVTNVSGADIPGATVLAPAAGRSVTEGGWSGAFTLFLPAGNHMLVLNRPGWLTRTIGPFTVTSGQETVVPDYVSVLTPGGVIEGTVVNAADGSRVAGATVAVDGTAISTTSDDAGAFLVSALPGTYTLTITKSGWTGVTIGALTVALGHDTNAGLVALTQQSGTLTGTIVSAADGSPIVGAQVVISGTTTSATTDGSGAFSLSYLTGSRAITVNKAGWAAAAAGPFTISGTQATPTGPISLAQPAGTITGTIVERSSGTAVAGAIVALDGTTLTTFTDGAGAFAFSVAPGFYTVVGSTEFGRGSSPILVVTPADTTSAGAVALAPAEGALSGTTVDSTSSLPVPGVQVTLYVSSYPVTIVTTTTSDANGRFQVVAPPGTYSISLRKTGWGGTVSPASVTVLAGQTTDVGNAAIQPKAYIGGKVVGRTGYPIADAWISAPPYGPFQAGSLGIFLADANPGSVALSITKNDIYPLTTDPISVESGFVTDAGNITVTRYGWVQGNVYGSTGEGVGGGTVAVNGTDIVTGTMDMPCWPAATCVGGYKVAAPAGTYPLTFGGFGYNSNTTPPVTFQDEVGQTLNVVLDPAPGFDIVSLTVSPQSVRPGEGATGTVTLNGPAPRVEIFPGLPDDPTVLLTSSNPGVTVPSSVIVPIGATSATFGITTSPSEATGSAVITGTYRYNTRHKSATLSFERPSLTGVAPGWTLPGAANVVAYGIGFGAGTTIELSGPVYAIGNLSTPLCNLSLGQCATVSVPSAANGDATALTFAVPTDLTSGVYSLSVKTASGVSSLNSVWLAADQAARTVPALAADQHRYAQALHSGQTVTGTFVANGDTSGISADYNYFYFFATAGSTIDATLERVDTSKPWEHPDSLDPEIEITVPDGFVPQNLVALDDQPGVDLNASLHGAVLPLTGMYVLRAATSRGFGDYRLHFAVTLMVAAAEGARIIPFMDAFATVPVNGTTTPTAIVLDPRGYQLSGAQMTIAATPQPGDRGQIEFAPAALTSNPDGSVQTTATARATGKVTFAPAFVDTFTSSVMSMTGVAVSTQSPRRIPRYQSVARQPFAVTGLYEGGWVGLSTGAYERLPVERHAARREVRWNGPNTQSAGFSAAKSKQGLGVARTATQAADHAPLTTDHDLEPLDASTAVPLREVEPHGMTATALAITSCGQTTFAQGIVPAGTVLHPPFAATLTDLTPSTGGTDPNGLVGVDGIHGHRIEKNARLKLEITDTLGQAPTYPVLVQLALGGPQHGQVILDPDGNRIACNVAAFVWHDRDDQGNLLAANEQFEIGMGTLSSYVGVAPDPVTPGQVIPVWGTAELLNLSAQAKVQINGAWADPLLLAYGVHPEPGKPDHFLCTDRQGEACPDVFEYWTGYQLDVTSQPPSSLPRVLLNAYFLGDRYGNVVYGPTATSATSPGLGVTVGFADQTSGTTSGDPAGYALTTTWPMSPAPSGQLTSTLAATYPDDPAGDWGGGTVSKAITYQFDTGSTHLLLQAQQYEKRLADRGLAVVDGPLPISVAPGATGSLATLADGSTPRLVLLALLGSDVTSLVTGWGEEPSSVPGWGWNAGGGCPDQWCWVQWNPPWDLVVETQATASFRLTLEDGTGRVASEGSFVVHTCPRAEHETDGPPPAQGCTDLAIPSTNGTVDVTLNQPGSARGYLGAELTQAPVAPGTYVVWVESLDHAYRVRETAQLVGRGPADEYKGGFAICTVGGGEILDENFQRIDQLAVASPRVVFVRYVLPGEMASQITADVQTTDASGAIVESVPGVPLTRVATSGVFLSGPITVAPNEEGMPAGPARLRARTMELPGTSIRAADGPGHLRAAPAAYLAASVATMSGLVYDFRIGTLSKWEEPNLIFGNGQVPPSQRDYINMSVRITTADGKPIDQLPDFGWWVNAITVPDPLEGWVDPASVARVDGDPGRYQFTYYAAPLPAGSLTVVRPHFAFSFTDGTIGFTSNEFQTARSPNECDFAGSDSERGSHCFGDPNFPIVYARLDFRRLIYHASSSESTSLTDQDYTDVTMDEDAIQGFLTTQGSWLSNLYFVGTPDEFDAETEDVRGLPGSVYSFNPLDWPLAFFDLNGNGHFESGQDDFLAPVVPGYDLPSDGSPGVRLSHVIWHWSQLEGVNPKLMIVQLQKESQSVSGDAVAGDRAELKRRLTWLLGVKNTSVSTFAWPVLQIAQATVRMQELFVGASGLPVVPYDPAPAHGGRLWPVRAQSTSRPAYQPYASDWTNIRILVGANVRPAVAFFEHSKSAYSLFRYTPHVKVYDDDGGVLLLLKLWRQYHFGN